MPELNRGTGLIVLEVRHSNPNGDPDAESEPRALDIDGRGLISPVSFKRKLRDLVANEDGPVWQLAADALRLGANGDGRRYRILESRGRERDAIFKMDAKAFCDTFWDARVFGNTFLEDIKGKDYKPGEKDHFISTGVVQFGPGISIAPIEVERLTTTNKAGVEEGKDRGMAPLGWRVVRHAVYSMPFFVNPMAARKTSCGALDIELLKFLIPHTYRNTASAVRPFVEVRHAWYGEHRGPLGSCPDYLIIDAVTPRKIHDPEEPSRSIEEYEIPTKLPEEIRSRLASFEDLCAKNWG
jgi:CRISPR-associated protein Csd2